MTESVAILSCDQIEVWLVQRFAQLADISAEEVDIDRPFVDYNFGSAIAVTVIRELASWLGRELPITLFWE
jgi:8-amino-7-oxononanoate synthase